MTTRRDCLKMGGLAAAAVAVSGCSGLTRELSQPAPAERWGPGGDGRAEPAVWRTLNRAAFGPRPGDVRHVGEIGLDAYLEEQLHPEHLDETPAIAWRLWRLDTLQADTDFRFEFPK